MQVAKACIVPVCGNEKFHLVHKFPSDAERFKQWMEAINSEIIEKLNGLNPEGIRKRYFICARHFKLSDYKNSESRSLNLTAVPSLNLQELNELNLTKAYQLLNQEDEDESRHNISSPAKDMVKEEINIKESPKILNPGASMAKPLVVKQQIIKVIKRKAPAVIQSPPPAEAIPPEPNKSPTAFVDQKTQVSKPLEFSSTVNEISTTPAKRIRTEHLPTKEFVPEIEITEPVMESTPEEVKPANKLLALFEVTPEQYEKLSQTLSSDDRNHAITNFMNLFESNEPEADKEIELILETGSLNLDLFWLRDHCRCELCYDHANHQRKIGILDIPDDIGTKSHTIDGDNVLVVWNDDHSSSYELSFLMKYQPGSELKANTEMCLWNQKLFEEPFNTNCRVSMRDYMSDPDVSKTVLESLRMYGVAFIDGVQPTEQNTEFVIRQLFPIHKTLFGLMWTFSDAKDHSDTAYSNIYLGPHNDNTYFNDASGLQILHCINHSGTGGENFLIDGYQVAQKIKEEHPDVYKRLCNTIVSGEYIEQNCHHKYSAPIIILDPMTEEVLQIRYNLYDRAPFNTLPAKKIRQFYGDLKILTREMENPENRMVFKLSPGTVMIFDNWRVLHGRMAYTGKRTMTGCYVSRTEYQSAMRTNGFIE